MYEWQKKVWQEPTKKNTIQHKDLGQIWLVTRKLGGSFGPLKRLIGGSGPFEKGLIGN